MSRRHKETDSTDNYKPQIIESHDDSFIKDILEGKPKSKSILSSAINHFHGLSTKYLSEKIAKTIVFMLDKRLIELEDRWLKIHLSAFEKLGDGWLQHYRNLANPQPKEERKPSKRGAHPIKRLFKRIVDSKVMELFHNTWNEVKQKCMELYENITQFSVCFLHGSHKAFAPDEDPYRKVSHYYDMIKAEVSDFPSRKTLSNYNNWFVNWRPVVFNESPKEKNDRHRHSYWQQLIEWIYYYLQKIAPEYAVQMQRG